MYECTSFKCDSNSCGTLSLCSSPIDLPACQLRSACVKVVYCISYSMNNTIRMQTEQTADLQMSDVACVCVGGCGGDGEFAICS